MSMGTILEEILRRLGRLEADSRVVTRGGGGGGFWGIVEFGDGTRVENLNRHADRPYLQINLASQTVEEFAGPIPTQRTDGVIYREKAALFGICYIDRAA